MDDSYAFVSERYKDREIAERLAKGETITLKFRRQSGKTTFARFVYQKLTGPLGVNCTVLTTSARNAKAFGFGAVTSLTGNEEGVLIVEEPDLYDAAPWDNFKGGKLLIGTPEE
jgi:hypothetical protein